MRWLISHLFSCEKSIPKHTRVLLEFAIALWVSMALAQSNLGELLDSGAKKLSPEEFREDVVQRMIVGPLNNQGGSIELMYANNGEVQGIGQSESYPRPNTIGGIWKIDDSGRICESMHFEVTFLPYRCQFWFKYADHYFLSDSDSDRRTRVLRRTVKQ
jgi:hypothetical protein